MLIVLMVFCAGGGLFLIGLAVYSEFRDLWAHPDHRVHIDGSRYRKHGS